MKRLLACDALGCEDELEARLDRLYEIERQAHLERRFNRSERRQQGVSKASQPRGDCRTRIVDLLGGR